MENLRLISIWSDKRKKDHYVSYHSHDYYELVYYAEGSGTTTIGEQSFHFIGGSFVLIPPRVLHDEAHQSDSQVTCLMFAGGGSLPLQWGEDPFLKVWQMLTIIADETRRQPFGYKEMIAAKLTELYLHLRREYKAAPQEKNFEYIINFIKENYHDKISLSHCAAQLGLSYDYFQHKFKVLTGASPQQFLLARRIHAAKRMLKSSNLNCTEIAFACGFSTSAQFSAVFKRETGLSPLLYKKREMVDRPQ